MIYPQNFEEKIEFNLIREQLKEKCLSALGVERVDEMSFLTDFESIITRLKETEEFVHILQEEDTFPNDYFFDVRSSLKRITVEGMYMTEQELFDLRRSLETIEKILSFLRRKAGDDENAEVPYPCLKQLAGETESFPHVIRDIDAILNKFGKIKDNASPLLQNIRHELTCITGSISRSLQKILHNAQSEGLVEKDAMPTVRDGRLVIPVAPALKRKIKGIVHDESATGKTVFIEPAEVVEANNRIRELEAEEHREIIRILQSFSTSLRPSIPLILQSYEFLAEIDFIRAKAQLAILFNGIRPAMENIPMIDWGTAVHPLLQQSLNKHGKTVVPLDIELTQQRRILIISGPNAGGKSICLKTVGLLQYMLQCGLLIPIHESSKAGVFNSLFIDIGDEQSIENDLSTYSSHLTNMKQMLKWCDKKSIVLIDEFGSGTEPLIGGAIAESVLKRLNEASTFGVITTHYQNLKHFADVNKGIVNGAMLYDRQLMRPLFQLQIGNPGSSFAIEIARKIGLPEEVIADASEIVGSDYIMSDKYLQDIVRDKRYWENKRQNIRQREKNLEESISKYEAAKEEMEKNRKTILQQAKEEAKRLLDESNAKIENTIRTIVEAKADKEKTKLVRKELTDYKKQVEEQQDSKQIEDKINRQMELLIERDKRKKERKQRKKALPVQTLTPKEKVLSVGDLVQLVGQKAVGKIMEVNGNQATVLFGVIKTTVALNRLKPCEADTQTDKPQAETFLSRQTQDVIYEKKLNFKQDIDVRGMRGDEAVMAVTYFIDDALLFRVSRVRILHGTGNGILRTLIRQYLQTTPGVAQFRDEHVQFGGAGITVVDLE